MTHEREFKASFHGHSPYSDGIDPIGNLVDAAIRYRITFFGISDHNTTSGVNELYRQVATTNEKGEGPIIPVAATEISTIDGDVVLAKPSTVVDADFLSWAQKAGENKSRLRVAEVIKEGVSSFGALAIIVHPGAPFMHSVSFRTLRKLPEQLDNNTVRNVGVEVKNWSARIMIGVNELREIMLARLVQNLDLAQFGFADFHSSWQVGTQFTSVFTADATAESLIVAVQQRRTFPNKGTQLYPNSWTRLFFTFVKSHQANR